MVYPFDGFDAHPITALLNAGRQSLDLDLGCIDPLLGNVTSRDTCFRGCPLKLILHCQPAVAVGYRPVAAWNTPPWHLQHSLTRVTRHLTGATIRVKYSF
ncbi:hypothetical protein D3C85_1396430 [compost metagenome]